MYFDEQKVIPFPRGFSTLGQVQEHGKHQLGKSCPDTYSVALYRAVEMALKFPHAKVVGMDLIQSSPRSAYHNVCRFLELILIAEL